jgi:DHA2 family multidrug resistance protein
MYASIFATMASVNEAAPDGDALLPVRYKGLLTFAIMMAMMMQILDTTIANVALPHMQTSLGATIDTIAWVLTSYIVATAVAIPITGWLADRVGSRNLFLWAVAFFIFTSMLCGAATSLEQMVAFRIMQGIAAAFIGPISQTAMLDINPSHKHGQAMAIWSLGAVMGPILGPLIGGYITEYYNWRWVFYVNLPLGSLILVMLYFLLPSRPIAKRGFDLFGFSMFALGLAALQLVLDRGQQLDWLESTSIWIGIGCIIIGFWVFIIHMLTGKNTLLTPAVFKDRNLVGSLVFVAFVGVLVFAIIALIAPMLQGVLGYPVINAGILLAPRGLGVIVAMGIAARLMNVVDARILLAIGWAIAAWSCYMMTHWTIGMDSGPVITVGVIQGLGIGFIFVPLNVIAFATLPVSLRPEGAALMNLLRNVGASIGISITASNVARNLQVSHADLSAHITPSTLPSLGLERLNLPAEQVAMLLNSEINRQALMIGYINNFWLIMWGCIIAIPASMLLKKLPKTGTASVDETVRPDAEPQPAE